jgi:uncharacterized protein YggE
MPQIAAGAARVTAFAFTVADPTPVQASALRRGCRRSGTSGAIADSLKVTLRGVLEASTDTVERPMPKQFSGAMMRAEAAMATTPIDPGDVTTEARVRVVYAID